MCGQLQAIPGDILISVQNLFAYCKKALHKLDNRPAFR